MYNGKQRHPDDLSGVVDRARQIGCTKLVVTGSSFRSSREALAIAKEYREHPVYLIIRYSSELVVLTPSSANTVYTTAGVHPCSSSIFAAAHPHSHDDSGSESAEHTPACDPDPDAPIPDGQTIDPHKTNAIITDLRTLIDDGRKSGGLVAFGEFGLDYDRLHYCSKSLQVHSFNSQLTLAASLSPQLPLFLHSRAAHADFVACLKTAFGDKLEKLERGGVVHSFTGTAKEMAELMELGLFIGLNGCSFKTAENCEVAKTVRLDRLMIETDGPWCEVRPSHDGWKYLVDMDKREREREAALEVLPSPQPEAEAQPGPEPAKMETPSLENRNGEAHQQRPKKQKQQQQSLKKSQQKEPEVLERFRSVKKEKWVEGVMVKSRNEPCMIERVAKIVAGIKGIEVEEVCEAAWRNTVKVFGLNDS